MIMRLWGSLSAVGLVLASLLDGAERGFVEIVEVQAGDRLQISLQEGCFDEDGKVRLAFQMLKPSGTVATRGKQILRDSIEVSRRRVRSAPVGGRRRRAILEMTIDWSSDQLNRPLGQPLRRGPRRVGHQRSRRPRHHQVGGRRRRANTNRWKYSTINEYPSSEVINYHYDTDEELSENDVWHPRNQMRRGLGRRLGRRYYYDSEDSLYTYFRRRPRRDHGRRRRGGRRRRSARRRHESTTTEGDTDTENLRDQRRRRGRTAGRRRVTGPIRQRYLNDFDEEISGELVTQIPLPPSLFPDTTPAYTNTRTRLRTTTLSTATTVSTVTETTFAVTTTETMTAVTTLTETMLTGTTSSETTLPSETKPTETATTTTENRTAIEPPAEPTLPVIAEAEIVTFQ